MNESRKGFIEELQEMSEQRKKQVLIIATIVIMVIVITIWLAYFNNIVASASEPTIADASSTAAGTAASGSSVWQNIENGMASIGNIFHGSSNYAVQPNGNQ